MQKILLILTFSLMFCQTELTTRVYDLSINLDAEESMPFNISEITGIELYNPIVFIQFIENLVVVEGSLNSTHICLIDSYDNYNYLAHVFVNGAINEQTSVTITDNDFVLYSSGFDISGTIKLAVTAEFPDQDIGLNGDLNEDEIIDILDVLLMVNIILDEGSSSSQLEQIINRI